MTGTDIKKELEQVALAAGFSMCRVATAARAPHAREFFAWLKQDHHAGMEWIAREPTRRVDPRAVLPGARSVVMLATNYFTRNRDASERAPLSQGDVARGVVARYARGFDYHNILKKRVARVAAWLASHGGTQRCYTDTGPVLERDFAALSGIGWQGKSTMLLNQSLGTWFFLSSILTTLEIEPDTPVKHRCGTCERCLRACPTAAFTAPYRLDARRCLSYLTIEHRGPIPIKFREALGARIFGCDDCLAVCPWNRFARASNDAAFAMRPQIGDAPLRALLAMNKDALRALIRGTPLARAGTDGLKRNICVALGNIGGAEDLDALRRAEVIESELVAEHARWAIARIEARFGKKSRQREEATMA